MMTTTTYTTRRDLRGAVAEHVRTYAAGGTSADRARAEGGIDSITDDLWGAGVRDSASLPDLSERIDALVMGRICHVCAAAGGCPECGDGASD